jgi:hypothetical protein
VKCRPCMMVAAEDRQRPGAVAEVKAFLEALDYAGFFFDNAAVRAIDTFDLAKDQNVANLENRTSAPRYADNFLFFPREYADARLRALASLLGPGQQAQSGGSTTLEPAIPRTGEGKFSVTEATPP